MFTGGGGNHVAMNLCTGAGSHVVEDNRVFDLSDDMP